MSIGFIPRTRNSTGLDPALYAGHSLRAGFATQAYLNGAPEFAILRQTRHKSLDTMRKYIRDRSLFRDNPATCGGAGDIARRAVSLIALLITGAAGALALSLWKRNRSGELRAEGAPIERVRAMAIAGVVLSAGFFLVIVAQALPDFILAGCA